MCAQVVCARDCDVYVQVLERASSLNLNHLKCTVALTQRGVATNKWAQRANIALRRRTVLAALITLRGEATSLTVVADQLDEVTQRIEVASEWSRRAKEVLAGGATLALLRTLQEEAKTLDVTVPEEEAVIAKTKAIDWWLKRVAGAFLKRGCNIGLVDVLEGTRDDVRDEVSPAAASSNSTSGLACLFCTGNDASTLNRFMIGCDKCERWYHGPCVGVGKGAADAMDDYLCPLCAQETNVPYAFGPPLPVPRMTRRPRLKQVMALLAEVEEIGVETPEAVLVRQLAEQARKWQARAIAVLNDGNAANVSGDEDGMQASGGATDAGASPSATSKARGGELLPSNAEEFLSEGEACEVEPEALPAIKKLALRLAAWHRSALAVLNGEHSVEWTEVRARRTWSSACTLRNVHRTSRMTAVLSAGWGNRSNVVRGATAASG